MEEYREYRPKSYFGLGIAMSILSLIGLVFTVLSISGGFEIPLVVAIFFGIPGSVLVANNIKKTIDIQITKEGIQIANDYLKWQDVTAIKYHTNEPIPTFPDSTYNYVEFHLKNETIDWTFEEQISSEGKDRIEVLKGFLPDSLKIEVV